MRKVVLVLWCLVCGMSFLGCEVEQEEVGGIVPMGMNVGAPHYYHSRVLMFNDVMKTRHKIGTARVFLEEYAGELDSEGYPVEVVPLSGNMWNGDAPCILINSMYEGDYVLLYDGEGHMDFAEGMEVVTRQQGRIYLKLTARDKTEESDPHRRIIISKSVRGNNIRNLRLIPVEFEGREQEMPLFRSDFLHGLKQMQVLRFMEAQYTNSSTQVHFSDRPKVDDWAYDVQGLPLEILIELANTLKIDAWFCVPHKASDDYITKMAELIKEKLDEDLKCYIEYSNEIWHEGFPQGKWIQNGEGSVDDYIVVDLQNLRSPKYKTDTKHLKNAYFMERTFRLFSQVFVGESRNRLVTVGTYYFWEYTREILDYLIEHNQRPDVMAGKGYFSYNEASHNKWLKEPQNVSSDDVIDAVLDIWDKEIVPTVIEFAEIVREYQIDYVVYEGGQHMQPFNQGKWAYNQAVYDSQIHPRMYDLYMKNYELHASLGCKMFANFTYLGKREQQFGSWGVLENVEDAVLHDFMNVAPKYQAVLDANLFLAL